MEKTYAWSIVLGTCTTMIESDSGVCSSLRGSTPTSRMLSGPLMSETLVADAALPNRSALSTAPAYRAIRT
jgi:hypothetical protein